MTAYNGFEYPINLLLKSAWESANERVKNNPDLRIIEDIESGYPQVVTKEEHERYLQLWESFKPKFDKPFGKLFIYGTGGKVDKKGWQKCFKNGNDDSRL